MPTVYWPLFVWCLFWAMAVTGPAGGHSWYPADCCSDKDCKPIDAKDVGESGANYTYKGMKFPKAQVRPSPDDQYHACIMSAGFGFTQIRCMWRPTPGS